MLGDIQHNDDDDIVLQWTMGLIRSDLTANPRLQLGNIHFSQRVFLLYTNKHSSAWSAHIHQIDTFTFVNLTNSLSH
jgi:hypothetical protein